MTGMDTPWLYNHPRFCKFCPLRGGRFEPSAGHKLPGQGRLKRHNDMTARNGCELLPVFYGNQITNI